MSRLISLAHLSSAHKDGDVRIFHKECVSLAEAGYNVHLVIPNTQSRIEKGVHIVSFNFKTKFRILRAYITVNKVYREALKINADVYHLHDPELLRIAPKLKKLGKKVIYDAHEDLPRQILSKNYIPLFFRKTISKRAEKFENKIAKQLDAIVTATPFIHDRFVKINKNTTAINNYPILKEMIIDIAYHSKPKNEICYVGGITLVRGVKELVQSLPNTNAQLILAGNFENDSIKKQLENESGWKQVKYMGFVSRSEVIEIYKKSRVGLVTLHPIINYLDALPVKMFEYMAAGIPVICSDFPLWKKIVEDNNCGLCTDPKNPESIAQCINQLLSDEEFSQKLGQNGKTAIIEKYNWDVEAKKLILLYQQLVDTPTS